MTSILPQNDRNVKFSVPLQLHSERAEILALADIALSQFNQEWARFIATGSDEAFRLAMAARQDRETLLGEVSR